MLSLERLLVNSKLLVVKLFGSQKLYTDFQLLKGQHPNPCIVQRSIVFQFLKCYSSIQKHHFLYSDCSIKIKNSFYLFNNISIIIKATSFGILTMRWAKLKGVR